MEARQKVDYVRLRRGHRSLVNRDRSRPVVPDKSHPPTPGTPPCREGSKRIAVQRRGRAPDAAKPERKDGLKPATTKAKRRQAAALQRMVARLQRSGFFCPFWSQS